MQDRSRRLADLRQPWARAELLAYLEELAAPDPRAIWIDETRRGLVSGIDQIIHFFFDDHDLDHRALGDVLIDKGEVAAVKPVLCALDHLVQRLPDGGDDDYAGHAAWPAVRNAAREALERLRA